MRREKGRVWKKKAMRGEHQKGSAPLVTVPIRKKMVHRRAKAPPPTAAWSGRAEQAEGQPQIPKASTLEYASSSSTYLYPLCSYILLLCDQISERLLNFVAETKGENQRAIKNVTETCSQWNQGWYQYHAWRSCSLRQVFAAPNQGKQTDPTFSK